MLAPPPDFIRGTRRLSKLLSRIIVFGAVMVLLAAAAITLEFKLPKFAAAQQSLAPAIVSSHLLKLQPDLALP